MTTETPLSEKDIYCTTAEEIVYSHKDVRDAVRRLRIRMNTFWFTCKQMEENFELELEEIFGKELCEDDNSPSQQTSVDKREIGTTKKISDVGENPILDTQTHPEDIKHLVTGHKFGHRYTVNGEDTDKTSGCPNQDVCILDDNPLSISMYMEEHPEISFDDKPKSKEASA